MSTSDLVPSPTLGEINSRVSEICAFLDPPDVEDLFWYLIHRDREPSAKMIKVEKVALEFLAWQDARNLGGESFKAHGVKDRYSAATLPDGKDRKQKSNRVRTFADKLRDKLDSYYLSRFGIPPLTAPLDDPTESDVSAGRAKWEVYIAIPERKGWKPIIQWRARSIRKPIEPVGDRVDFECIGTNLEAMQYLAKHIPLAKKIEDTAIRWDANNMPYAGLDEFKAALKQSKVTYVLITGPVKYKDYMEGLREIFWDKSEQSASFKCFRLDRTAPIMNFTILYYPDKSSEVLYGYGIQQGNNSVESTTVFRSNNPDLVKEYKRLFMALRNHSSSNPISVRDPDFVDSDKSENDVSATVKDLAHISIEKLVKKQPTGEINVCVPCATEIDRLVEILKEHLSLTTPIRILLSHPNSPFLSWREKSLARDLKKLVRTNLESLQRLWPRSKCDVKLTDKVMPVMFVQVGHTIIFSPFWDGIAVSTCRQFMVRANSETGSFLKERFEQLWTDEDGIHVELSGEDIRIPSPPQKPHNYLNFRLGITVRKALADDASAVCTIANSRSRITRSKAQLSERQLAREGFLYYPLTREQYLERIQGSDHFWVAERDGRVVAYCMAYTFKELQSFRYLTENDQTVLTYFQSWGCEYNCVYLAQAGTVLSHDARGAMAELAVCLPKYAIEKGVPAILCEISLMPRNEGSLAAANRNGLRMIATRTKKDPANGTDRVSGTFMKILESQTWR